jgi:hypothetical protein
VVLRTSRADLMVADICGNIFGKKSEGLEGPSRGVRNAQQRTQQVILVNYRMKKPVGTSALMGLGWMKWTML